MTDPLQLAFRSTLAALDAYIALRLEARKEGKITRLMENEMDSELHDRLLQMEWQAGTNGSTTEEMR